MAISIKKFSGSIFAAICANLIKIDSVTPEITRVKTAAPILTNLRKSKYLTEYLSNCLTDLH